MEVCNQLIYDAEGVSRTYHNLCLRMQSVLTCGIQIVQYSLQGIVYTQCVFALVRLVLVDVQGINVPERRLVNATESYSHKVQRFQRTH